MTEGASFFSPDYATARERFRAAAQTRGAQQHVIALDARGPADEALTIDIAWLGTPTPRRVLLHTSGLHGVEAFAGAAVQLALLQSPPVVTPGTALILVHVLNPWGMAWLRRTNEHNVDLNRNFLAPGESWSGAPPRYRQLDPLLNPPAPPRNDMFWLRAAGLVLRHGLQPLRQAIAQGQYVFPRGLFYGGNALQQGPEHFLHWLQFHLSEAEYVFALDVHSGLGRWGTNVLIPEAANATPREILAAALRADLIKADQSSSAYTVRGGMDRAIIRTLHHARVDTVLQEFGTYNSFRVLHALRDENRWHHFGSGGLTHPAKQRLAEALCPASPQWRAQAVALGTRFAHAAAAWAFQSS